MTPPGQAGDVNAPGTPAQPTTNALPGLPEQQARRIPSAARLLPSPAGNPALDRLAELAARLLGTSAAQVSLLTDRQTVAGGAGLTAGSVGSRGALADSLCTVTADGNAPLIVPDAAADPRVQALPPVSSGAVGAYLGVPLVADDGRTVGALCVFDPTPRSWAPADVTLLQQLAASAVAELELSALSVEHETSRVLWELAIDAAGIGTFDWDLTTGTLSWDDRLIELFGYARADFTQTIEAFNARVHPDDLPAVTRALQHSIDSGGDFAADYRIQLPNGTLRWIDARGRALVDPSGTSVRLLGAAYDVTPRQEQETRVAQVLETMSAAFFSLDRDWRFTYVNNQAETLLGHTRDQLLGGVLWELFPAAVGSEFETHYRSAADGGQPVTFEAYYPPPLDAWYEVRVWPSPHGLSVYFLDITARRHAQAAADAAAARTQLLVEVTAALTETLDTDQAMTRLAELVVPALADWCIVTLLDDTQHTQIRRQLRDVAGAHRDPARQPLVEQYRQLRLDALTEDSFLARAASSNRPVSVPDHATTRVAAVLQPGPARDLLVQLAPDSALVLPLRGRGRTVGLLTLFTDAGRVALTGQDLQAAHELAGRAGLAIDNTRLYQQQRSLAEGLQRSLLTEPPEPDHSQVVVRYEPAAEAAQVGGDWYDAFLQPDGATMLVIGDVIGHDTAAAAAMGQLRSVLRALAAAGAAGPADVLRQVDQVMQTLRIDTTASVVVARLEQTPRERNAGTTRLRWSNAGHPPPMVLHPDGTATALAGDDTDLLLGIDPDSPRTEMVVTLERDATVLLYTDGLVERRGQSLDDGLDKLRATLVQLADTRLDLDSLCDAVLARMLPPRSEDDVALVAVRLHRQDRPRPASAGPRRLPDNVPDVDADDAGDDGTAG